MNVLLDKAIRAATANGHHLVSDHTAHARRWSCVVCERPVILWPEGHVSGTATEEKCESPL